MIVEYNHKAWKHNRGFAKLLLPLSVLVDKIRDRGVAVVYHSPLIVKVGSRRSVHLVSQLVQFPPGLDPGTDPGQMVADDRDHTTRGEDAIRFPVKSRDVEPMHGLAGRDQVDGVSGKGKRVLGVHPSMRRRKVCEKSLELEEDPLSHT